MVWCKPLTSDRGTEKKKLPSRIKICREAAQPFETLLWISTIFLSKTALKSHSLSVRMSWKLSKYISHTRSFLPRFFSLYLFFFSRKAQNVDEWDGALLGGDIFCYLQTEIMELHFPSEKWHPGSLGCASRDSDEVGCLKVEMMDTFCPSWNKGPR